MLKYWRAEGSLSRPADIKAGHSAEQEIISLFFLKSEKWPVIRDKGVEVACPMITEKNTGDKMNTQRSETMLALTQTRQTDNKYTSAENTALGLPGPPNPETSFPLRLSYQQGVHRASRLPSKMLGLGLKPARFNPLTEPATFPARCRASALCRLGRPLSG